MAQRAFNAETLHDLCVKIVCFFLVFLLHVLNYANARKWTCEHMRVGLLRSVELIFEKQNALDLRKSDKINDTEHDHQDMKARCMKKTGSLYVIGKCKWVYKWLCITEVKRINELTRKREWQFFFNIWLFFWFFVAMALIVEMFTRFKGFLKSF